ncbi:hypothetical protein ACJX0J_012662, partial [Zea mays]
HAFIKRENIDGDMWEYIQEDGKNIICYHITIFCVDVIKMGGKVSCMITHGPWVLIGIPKFVEALNTKTGMKLRFQGPSSLVCSMAITNEMLFAGTGDGRIMAWRFPAKDSNTEPVLILSGHQRPVISLSILARRLYSGSLDKSIK